MAEDEMVGWHHLLTDMSLSKLWETVQDKGAWCAVFHGVPEWDTTGQLDCLDVFVDSLDCICGDALLGPSVLFR